MKRTCTIAAYYYGIALLFSPPTLAQHATSTPPGNVEPQETAKLPTPRENLIDEAAALRPIAHSTLARQMLDATRALPAIETRTIYYHPETKQAVSRERAETVDPAQLAKWKKLDLDEHFYYYTRYGTPLASMRAFDLAAMVGLNDVDGKRIVDFGYGSIGQLRLLASLGAHVTGIEVDPVLRELYAGPGDVGSIARFDNNADKPAGSITLVHGQWPADESVRAQVGNDYDLFISKNTLKRGYVHPERDVDPRLLVHLDVDDETYVNAMFDLLNPGGFAIIYNISPAPSKADEPYKPWSDGRCPFAKELFEKAGFEVIRDDEDDTEFVKVMAKMLGWDQSMDIENDLFAHYTLVRKPGK